MEEITTNFNIKPVFRDQPILCPWITCQPYPSSQLIKNKLSDFVKKHGAAALNTTTNSSSSSKKQQPSSAAAADQANASGPYAAAAQHSSSTHFFYFLRLMQLFPGTHPATLHTVLTLSKHNFFFAIDKLLYAQKCKNDLSRKLSNSSTFNGRGRGYVSNRGRQSSTYTRTSQQRYQTINTTTSSRSIPTDLAEVQRIIDLAEKPYFGVQSGAVDTTAGVAADGEQHMTDRVVKICVDNQELVHGTQTFVDTDNHEVIEIVCFNNEQNVLKQTKDDDNDNDSMEIETFNENVEHLEPSIGENMRIDKIHEDAEADEEPPVIVVESGEPGDCIVEGHPVESQVNSADLSQNNHIDEEITL